MKNRRSVGFWKVTSREIGKLDVVFSEYIRRRAIAEAGGCERCRSPKYDIEKEDGKIFPAWKQLQCSHFWGRAKKSVRWDPDNAAGLCAACHIYFGSHPQEHVQFFVQRLGQVEYDLLEARANMPQRYIDINGIWLYLRQKLKELE